jgi:hypothetical protein
MSKVKIISALVQIKQEIDEADAFTKTARPKGPSHGAFYERIGIYAVALIQNGVSPMPFLEKMAAMTGDEIDLLELTLNKESVSDSKLFFVEGPKKGI